MTTASGFFVISHANTMKPKPTRIIISVPVIRKETAISAPKSIIEVIMLSLRKGYPRRAPFRIG